MEFHSAYSELSIKTQDCLQVINTFTENSVELDKKLESWKLYVHDIWAL